MSAAVTDRARGWFRGRAAMIRYGLVGTFNSLLDLGLFSLFSVGLRITEIGANVMSTSIVLCVSYVLNRLIVFRSNRPVRSTVVHFASVTLFTGLIVQSTVVWMVVHLGALLIASASYSLLAPLAKLCAMGVATVSNYIGYRWIFHERGPRSGGVRRADA